MSEEKGSGGFPEGFRLMLPAPYLQPTLSKDEARALLRRLREGDVEFDNDEVAPMLITQLEEWFD